jgi:hypothetical protein
VATPKDREWLHEAVAQGGCKGCNNVIDAATRACDAQGRASRSLEGAP